ncbi:MAG: hypothetical protein U9P49_08690 [Thermodesulfobacteriota bacterium]|nr:hypothetical protein [Thermodesulfobacteriota bacterium]
MRQNYLKAVFWDYPDLCDPEGIHQVLDEARCENDKKTIYWIMARFLDRGRVRDTAMFFRPKEIRGSLKFLKISAGARKRWERLIEVYGDIS